MLHVIEKLQVSAFDTRLSCLLLIQGCHVFLSRLSTEKPRIMISLTRSTGNPMPKNGTISTATSSLQLMLPLGQLNRYNSSLPCQPLDMIMQMNNYKFHILIRDHQVFLSTLGIAKPRTER